MLEVVFSDSTKASLHEAGKHSDRIGETVAIGFSLDVGDISGALTGEKRKDEFVRLFGSVDFKPSELDEFFQGQEKDIQRLLAAAKRSETIRIWRSDAAFSECGFACVCSLIYDLDCPLSVVHLPRFWPMDDNTIQTRTSWQEISEERFTEFFSEEKPVANLEKMMRAEQWQKLCYENAALRAVVNGNLLSVPDNFYDFIIQREILEGEFLMARLIGNVLGKYSLGVSDGWYALRIRKMIAEGQLDVTADRDQSHPYGKVLKATSKFKLGFIAGEALEEER